MHSSITPLLVLCSFPDEGMARQIGTLLLEKQLAACISYHHSHSLYRWQGAIEQAEEVMAMIKTSRQHFAELRDEIIRHHPYEVPEIIGMVMNDVAPSYATWLAECLPIKGSSDAPDPLA